MQIFQKRLKDIRKERGLTQEAVGKGVFITKQEICLYEKGKRTPPLEVIIKLADFLEVDFLWLLGLEYRKDLSKSKVIHISKEEIEIIKRLRENKELYDKLINDLDRTMQDLTLKSNK